MNIEPGDIKLAPGIRIILSGGATGGHLFPGIAIAESLRERAPNCVLLFVGTGTALEKRVLPAHGFDFEIIATEGIKGRTVFSRIRAVVKLMLGTVSAAGLLRRFKPDLIIGVGGYASAPVIICGWLLGVNIALHEQNALPGISNRLLSRLAERVFVSLPPAVDRFASKKVLLTGNPVREDILKLAEAPEAGPDAGREAGKPLFTVLVIGGSQGAAGINRAVMAALEYLDDAGAYYFIHQTGAADETTVRQAYQRYGVACRAQPFFDDMAGQYAAADFVVCRAGATTVAEITCLGKVALLVPFPHAADDHQAYNAQALVEAGGAEMIREKDLSGKMLAERIVYYAARPERLAEMSGRLRVIGRPRAGITVAEESLILATAPRKWRSFLYACI